MISGLGGWVHLVWWMRREENLRPEFSGKENEEPGEEPEKKLRGKRRREYFLRSH